MILEIVSVRDSAVDSYGSPIFVRSVGEAVRSFGDEAVKDDSAIRAHPGDYTLFHVGSFDTDTGQLLPLPNPTQLARGVDYKAG